MTLAWHFVNADLCKSGLHASRRALDALQCAPGPIARLVELAGRLIESYDKLVARRRRVIRAIDATEVLRRFACEQALAVAHLWNCPPVVRRFLETRDESLRTAAGVAVWTAGAAASAAAGAAAGAAASAAAGAAASAAAGAAASAAARAAARAAAWAAAWAAAEAAAGDAAGAAARDAQNAILESMLLDEGGAR